MYIRDLTSSSSFIDYSTFNSEHNWKDLGIPTYTESTNMHFHDNHNWIRGGLIFNPIFICSIVGLVKEHNVHCVNLIGQSWRTWEVN